MEMKDAVDKSLWLETMCMTYQNACEGCETSYKIIEKYVVDAILGKRAETAPFSNDIKWVIKKYKRPRERNLMLLSVAIDYLYRSTIVDLEESDLVEMRNLLSEARASNDPETKVVCKLLAFVERWVLPYVNIHIRRYVEQKPHQIGRYFDLFEAFILTEELKFQK